MEDTWSIQTSNKYGPNNEHMLNVRGNDADDFIGKVGYLVQQLSENQVLGDLHSALQAPGVVQAVQNIQAAMPGTQRLSAGPQQGYNQANLAVPHCDHGPMKDCQGMFTASGKPYQKRWYCQAPKGATQTKNCWAKD